MSLLITQNQMDWENKITEACALVFKKYHVFKVRLLSLWNFEYKWLINYNSLEHFYLYSNITSINFVIHL